ncbi:uncharacterized protein LOC142606223 [Castanea sativa]|uniref:uncharacterized protein LOC142606223 n=1 Tax=Castanea sativa TaxID=21020 RepID=UPI003F64C7C5
MAVAQDSSLPSILIHSVVWAPPWDGFFKINVDGAVFKRQEVVGVGVVIRDNEVGVRDVVLEGDSMIVYNALCDFSPAPSSIAAVIQGIQDMSSDFRSVGYSHVRRQGNLPAHLLAKYASSITDYVAWIEEDPCCIKQALIQDVNSIS